MYKAASPTKYFKKLHENESTKNQAKETHPLHRFIFGKEKLRQINNDAFDSYHIIGNRKKCIIMVRIESVYIYNTYIS